MSLLYVTSSLSGPKSTSRGLADEFIANWRKAHPDASVVSRHLTVDNTPHLSMTTLAALGKPAQERTADEQAGVELADQIIAEAEAADTIVIAAPMYNFSVPSTLKAWIDHLARAGRTFRYTESGPIGQLKDKKVYVVIARGGFTAGGPMDFIEPYLRTVLGFLGLTDVTFVNAEGMAMGPEPAAKSLAAARSKISEIAA